MNIRVFAAGACALACSTGASAQQSVYVEALIGAARPGDLETEAFVYDDGIDIYEGRISGDLKTAFAAGAEIGVQGLLRNRLRFGGSYDYMNPKLKSLSFVGEQNGLPYTETASVSDIEDAYGVEFGTTAHTVLANGYLTFPDEAGRFNPYVGAGAGASFLENAGANLAFAATGGVNFAMNDQLYMGVRYRYLRIGGIEDELGIEYEPVSAHIASYVVGVRY